MSDQVVSESRVISAAPEVIFDLLADPSRHAVFDGSGTVRASRPDAPSRLTLGAQFGMDMKMGVPYRMTNTVVEFEENRRIGWRHVGGHVWRYELEPVEGGTKVTESFDMTTAKSPPSSASLRSWLRAAPAAEPTSEIGADGLARVTAHDTGRDGAPGARPGAPSGSASTHLGTTTTTDFTILSAIVCFFESHSGNRKPM
jgi:uncharacterized protein YndB with AHSA1/START domain